MKEGLIMDAKNHVLSPGELTKYLQRIGMAAVPEKADIDTLKKLQIRHLLSIPYENLDPMNGIPTSMDPAALYKKIVLHHRGGYCFELQGLFLLLLTTLGYHVEQRAGRFMDEPGHIQMRRHRILVVNIDGMPWLTDVGVNSESPRQPILLKPGRIQQDGISSYCIDEDSFYGHVLMQKELGKRWKPIYGFTDEPQIDDDFIMPSFYCDLHPNSAFNKYMKISIFIREANLTIVKNEMKVYRNGTVEARHTLSNETEAAQILSDIFRITVPDKYRLLP